MSEDESKIDRLDDQLNSRTRYRVPDDIRTPLPPEENTPSVGDKWRGPELDELLGYERKIPDAHPLMKKIFIVAVIFFLLAAGTAAYIYLGGGNFISSKNVDISVTGPVTVSAGDPVNLGITITNTNNADLQTADLSIAYPTGTRSPLDSTHTMSNDKFSFGSIASGAQVATSTSVVIYGEKGDVEDITMSLEYEIKGSNATFSKQKVYEVSIGSIPLSLTVSEPDTVTSGQSFTTTLSVVSNSTSIVKDVLVQAEYPYGFAVTGSSPTALNQDQNLWNLGDMAPGDQKSIAITGTLSGQNNEQRTFRFSTGVGTSDAPNIFDTSIVSNSETLAINRPDVGLVLSLGGENVNPYVAPSGQIITGTITYQNNMTGKLLNNKVVVNLSGQALDKFSVVAQNGGFYDSTNNQIVWDSTADSNLTSLSPGDTGTYTFQFASLAPATGTTNVQNQEIDLIGSISGEDQSGNPVSSSATETVRIASEIDLSAVSVYSIGPINNSGPIPPTAEKQTTYTILLDAKDTQNDILTPTVTATLGPNVVFVGSASSSPEIVSYDDTSRTITWNLGRLLSGTGFSAPVREAAFQISISPSTGQVGSVPILLTNISLSGQDSFTNAPVTTTAPPVTTEISTDPQYVQGDEKVVK